MGLALCTAAAAVALPAQGGAPGAIAQQTVLAPVLSASEHLAAGDKAAEARQPRQALGQFEAAVEVSPLNYEALWKASGAALDVAEIEGNVDQRAALYGRATVLAERAIVVNADGAESNFAMARAVGRTALAQSPRERVKLAKEVRARALKALAADSRHAGALHILGVWNAEIMRLGRMTRLVAKTMLGGEVLGTASWAAAATYLEQAVAQDPTRAVHRLDLARVYRDMGRKADARLTYESALRTPLKDVNDEQYRQLAARELRALR